MSGLRQPVVLLLLATVAPFIACFGGFLALERRSLLTTPQVYIAELKREGTLTYMIPLERWKRTLAADETCRRARVVVIGSSRVREIDDSVVGTSICNLYVDGLGTIGFERLSYALPPRAPSEPRQIVYYGLDHFSFWNDPADPTEPLDRWLLAHTPAVWPIYAGLSTLDYFQWRDLVEVVRRARREAGGFDDQRSIWYPDGHLYNARYYALKRAGRAADVRNGNAHVLVAGEFASGGIRTANTDALRRAVQRLHDNGYAVRAYWNPVASQHIAVAAHDYPTAYRDTIDQIDRLAATLPFERYVPAAATLDADRFGCSNDWLDTGHVDRDCMRRMFAATFAN